MIYEQTWLRMIEDRNLPSHTYNKPFGMEMIHRIKGAHLNAFFALEKKLPS
ncbi:MAG: nucleotidyltransferase substrate binding protein [Bdellovibrionales bacterium]|nr:nucleotidyltransferase substrate binding protein [Bdellovibrionales bacterium]